MPSFVWRTDNDGADFSWNRSFSEPDLSASQSHGNRFSIKHPHEYIAVDDLKYFRRRQPVDFHTQSNVCLYNSDEPVLPFGSLKTEYRRHYRALGSPSVRPALLRRATSLRLEGLMQLLTEHQDKYHWYTPEDLQFSRTLPVRNPESLQISENGNGNGKPKATEANEGAMKNSSFLTHPMLPNGPKILPREMFTNEPQSRPQQAVTSQLAVDKFKRDVAAQEQQKCHLQLRAQAVQQEPTPSEYKRQFVPFPIEKAYSIPQLSSFKLQGEFVAVPEYQDSFKMYANYSKSAPIKKNDNLRVSGAEVQPQQSDTEQLPEYRDKFHEPPKHLAKEKPLKTDDHLHPRGEFTKDVPEYYESFRDPQIKEMPERGKCREPYLRLRGKIEFNPEYRNTYLDFPRARPVVHKPTSCFRLPNAGQPTMQVDKSTEHGYAEPEATGIDDTDITATPEYRRAQYNYQLRERTPSRGARERQADNKANLKQSSDSTPSGNNYKRRPSRARQSYKEKPQQQPPPMPMPANFEQVGSVGKPVPARYGRRACASVLQNAANCREHSSIVEGNPKYSVGCRRARRDNSENQQQGGVNSFVVLDEPCKPSNWMKQTWYDS